MNTTLETVHGFQIVQWTQHWSLLNGAWYRDAVAIRLTDGERRLISVLEPVL